MNEAETRAELIDPKLAAAGWGVVEGSKILRERNCQITAGRIQAGGKRAKPLIADYILVYKGIKLAVVEAKARALDVGEGVAQAKLYADKLTLDTTYATNPRMGMVTDVGRGRASQWRAPQKKQRYTFLPL